MTFCGVAGACATTPDEDLSAEGEINASSHLSTACYEVQDVLGNWLPEVCGNQILVPAGGIHGLAVTLRGTTRHVHYRGYYGTPPTWGPEGKDGEKIGDPNHVLTAVRILISPRQQSHICYDLIDMAFNTYFNMCDNAIAGNMTHALRSISIKYTP